MREFDLDFRDEDVSKAAIDSLLYIETIFTFFSILDPERIKDIDSVSLCLAFEGMGEIGMAFTSAALSNVDRLKTEREKLAAQKGGEQ